MNLYDWIPAATTSSLLAAALWLLRSVISTRLTASVHNEFEQKVETLKAELRKSEELFIADLRSKEAQIEALRAGALTGLANRQAALDARRIEAVDQLWLSVRLLAPAKWVSATIAAVKFDAATKIAAENPRLREIFTAMGGRVDISKLYSGDADKARPYVSEMAWALFSAYQTILSIAMLKMEILKSGLDVPDLINKDRIQKLISVALPHQTQYVEKYDTGAYHYLLDELESRLLDELRKILKGGEADKTTVQQAAEILRESNSLMSSISASPGCEIPEPPPGR